MAALDKTVITQKYTKKLSENQNFKDMSSNEGSSIGNNIDVPKPTSNVPNKIKKLSEQARKAQAETYSKLDSAICVLNKLPTINYYMDRFIDGESFLLQSPMYVLIEVLSRIGVTDAKIINWLCDMLINALPSIEIGVKAVLIAKLKEIISCTADPRIPKRLRKKTSKYFSDYVYDLVDNNPAYKRGILVNVNSIDPHGMLNTSPWGNGRDNYFGVISENGQKLPTYKLVRADDFNAFLWYLIHNGRFPSPTGIEITDKTPLGQVDSDGLHFWYPNSGLKYKITNDASSLLSTVIAAPQYDIDNNRDKITPGQIFTHRGNGNNVSICFEQIFYGDNEEPYSDVLLPVSSDWSSLNWYCDKNNYTSRNIGITKNSRNYTKENAICNIEYIRPYRDKVKGRVYRDELIRVSVLPRPYVYAPYGGITGTVKKILFDANGQQDNKGRFTLPTDATTSSGTPYVRRVGVKMYESSTEDFVEANYRELQIKYENTTNYIIENGDSLTDEELFQKFQENSELFGNEECQNTLYLNAFKTCVEQKDLVTENSTPDTDARLKKIASTFIYEESEFEAAGVTCSEMLTKAAELGEYLSTDGLSKTDNEVAEEFINNGRYLKNHLNYPYIVALWAFLDHHNLCYYFECDGMTGKYNIHNRLYEILHVIVNKLNLDDDYDTIIVYEYENRTNERRSVEPSTFSTRAAKSETKNESNTNNTKIKSNLITFAVGEDSDNCILYINPKTGEYHLGGVTEETKNKLPDNFSKHLVECYKGLTVYEFNYDYIMSQRLFEPNIVAKRLLDAVKYELFPGLFLEQHKDTNQYSYNNQSQRIQSLIRKIIMEEDEEVYNCFYKFSNDDYDRMIQEAEYARYANADYTYTGREDNIDDILSSLTDSSSTLEEQRTAIRNAIESTIADVVDQSSIALQDKRQVKLKIVLGLVTNLSSIIMECLITPKMLLILAVNKELLGNNKINDMLSGNEEITMNNVIDSFSDITVQNLIISMKGVIVAIAKEIVEMIIKKLLDFVMSYISEIVAELLKKITLEQLQAYLEAYRLLMNLFKSFSCAANLFVSYASQLASLFNKVKKLVRGSEGTDLPTILDNVTYADIFDTGENIEDKPKEQC